MGFFLILAILSGVEDPNNIRKALEFQYQQKIARLEAKLELAQESSKTATERMEACIQNQTSLEKNILLLSQETASLQAQLSTAQQQKRQLEEEMKVYQIEAGEVGQDSVSENHLYQRALTQVGFEKWSEAILLFEEVARRFPSSNKADNSIFWIAKIYKKQGEKSLALAEFERLVHQYPKSDRSQIALQEIDSLKGGITE